jgi:hypothetical protein
MRQLKSITNKTINKPGKRRVAVGKTRTTKTQKLVPRIYLQDNQDRSLSISPSLSSLSSESSEFPSSDPDPDLQNPPKKRRLSYDKHLALSASGQENMLLDTDPLSCRRRHLRSSL